MISAISSCFPLHQYTTNSVKHILDQWQFSFVIVRLHLHFPLPCIYLCIMFISLPIFRIIIQQLMLLLLFLLLVRLLSAALPKAKTRVSIKWVITKFPVCFTHADRIQYGTFSSTTLAFSQWGATLPFSDIVSDNLNWIWLKVKAEFKMIFLNECAMLGTKRLNWDCLFEL